MSGGVLLISDQGQFQNSWAVLVEAHRKLPFYLTSAGRWVNQEPTDRPEGFPDYHWFYCHSGRGRVRLPSGEKDINAGEGMFLLPNEPHAYWATEQPWSVSWITFHGAGIEQSLLAIGLTESQVRSADSPSLVGRLIDNIILLSQNDDPLRWWDCSGQIYPLLLALTRLTAPIEMRRRERSGARLLPTLQLIEQHYAEPLTLADLAAPIGVTPQHLCSLFAQMMGIRPVRYLSMVRIQKAKEMLLAEPLKLACQIGPMVGYPNASYFNAIFLRVEGMTPQQFRRSHGIHATNLP